jgi:hypothetical protein
MRETLSINCAAESYEKWLNFKGTWPHWRELSKYIWFEVKCMKNNSENLFNRFFTSRVSPQEPVCYKRAFFSDKKTIEKIF